MNLCTENKITLDLSKPYLQTVRCVQGDRNSRIINIVITYNNQPYILDESIQVFYKIKKPDSVGIYNEATINSDGTVTIILTDQATVCSGKADAELQFIDNASKKILSTMRFQIIIEESVLNNSEIESNFESDIIDEMINHLSDYDNPHKIPDATIKIKGITQLTDSVTSNSTTTAATPKSVKTTYDKVTSLEETVGSLSHEILSNNQPTNQKNGDYWTKLL